MHIMHVLKQLVRNRFVFFFKLQSSTDLHAVSSNSGKLNPSAKSRVSHYRARFVLYAGIIIENRFLQQACNMLTCGGTSRA